MTINLIAFTILLITHDIRLMTAMIFVQGFLTSIRINVGFLYFMEMMPSHAMTWFGVSKGIFDAVIYLFATFYFMKVSKDWFYFALIGYVLNIISATGAWFLPESPRYLCEKGLTSELERSLKVIAKVNFKELNFNAENFKKREN